MFRMSCSRAEMCSRAGGETSARIANDIGKDSEAVIKELRHRDPYLRNPSFL